MFQNIVHTFPQKPRNWLARLFFGPRARYVAFELNRTPTPPPDTREHVFYIPSSMRDDIYEARIIRRAVPNGLETMALIELTTTKEQRWVPTRKLWVYKDA